MHIAVIGSGAAGLAAAWLLSHRHRVTLLEKDDRLGGHADTALLDGEATAVDTGFIVYNERTYPNLTAWFEALGVSTQPSDMSFAVSREGGRFEYAGGPRLGMLAQPSLLVQRRYWRMIADLLRFYRDAPRQIPNAGEMTLGDYLASGGYSREFLDDHLLPFGAAIWSTSPRSMLDYPAAAFIRFCDNHGLLQLRDRPIWRTVTGGSGEYVSAVRKALGEHNIRTDFQVSNIARGGRCVEITDRNGRVIKADQVVIASHADQALRMLEQASDEEQRLLGRFRYEPNLAILHTDTRLMPARRRAWCSWNYVERAGDGASEAVSDKVNVSYWMNRLQRLPGDTQYIVTLNPSTPPDPQSVLRTRVYEHPVFDADTWQAQQALWQLQGRSRTWFCGSYFGAGFHEDAIQSGFAVAEQLGGLQRPWTVANPSGRIVVGPRPATTGGRKAA